MSRLGKLFRAAAVAALSAVGAPSATAQSQESTPASSLPDVFDYLEHNQVTPAAFGRAARKDCGPGGMTVPCYPGTTNPCSPAYPGAPGAPTTDPLSGQPAPEAAPDFGGLSRGAGAGPTVGLNGYIENAAPVTMFRLRFDAGYGSNRPDRAEYFYAKCGCFRMLTPPQLDAHGPPLPGETGVDYQELTSTLEYAFDPRFSAFVNVPVRWLNPDVNPNAAGLSDLSFGTKYAFIYTQRNIVSFWLRAIAPSGRTTSGLGTGNWWIEPGLLFLTQLTQRWQVFGELRDQIPLAPRSDFTGNVLRYGLGTSYMIPCGCWGYVAPVVETVGWTVLSGKELADLGVNSSAGVTIVNAKFGVRIGFGKTETGQPYPTRSDLYLGYGRALTGPVWYKDLLRLEYRFFF